MITLARALRAAATAAALLCAAPAAAQNLFVALSPPGSTAVTHGEDSVISIDVRNTSATATLSDIEFKLPKDYVANGGVGPPGWSITRILGNGFWSIRFRATGCAVGVVPGQTGTFRMEVTAAGGAIAADQEDVLKDVTVQGSCGTGGLVLDAGWKAVTFSRRVLRLTGALAPAQGAPGLVSTATWTVRNLASAAVNDVAVARAVSPATGWTATGCTPATVSLGAAGTPTATASVTCGYTHAAAGTYFHQGTASGNGGLATSVPVQAGKVEIAAVTASFRFESRVASTGDRLRAFYTVQNNTTGPLKVTPPAYGSLQLTSLASSGSADPLPKNLAAGAAQEFVYSFDVTALVGSPYVAAGAATTSLGATNLATTPAGTVSDTRVEIVPNAVVRQRAVAPYVFDFEVTNNSAYAVEELRLVNPQNAAFTSMLPVSATGLTYASATRNVPAGTDVLVFTGSLAQGATAVVRVRFDALPSVALTTAYPFGVRVYPRRGGELLREITRTIALSMAPPDVADATLLSDETGQTLEWRNVEPHDGVVIFRAATAAALPKPADGVDYVDPANGIPGLVYADRDASTATRFVDPLVGEQAYRICNHDARFVYSYCADTFTAAVAPAGGWVHDLNGAALLVPGAVPGSRLAVGTNDEVLFVLDAATGLRVFDPVTLGGLPSRSTPVMPLVDGRRVVLTADQAGTVTAVELATGGVLWQVDLAGEAFAGGVSAVNHRFAPAAYQAAYGHDLILVPSKTGRLFGLNGATGALDWTLDVSAAGGPVVLNAGVLYDHGTNRLYVPTSAGVRAFDVGASSPAGDPPDPLAGWADPNPAGDHSIACALGPGPTDLACVDRAGLLHVVDKATGAPKATRATGLAVPSMLWPVAGAAPGYVVSGPGGVQRLTLSGTPAALALAGAWTPAPGVQLSPVQVFAATQTIVVGGSDRVLRKLRLADAGDTGATATIPTSAATLTLGPSVFDTATQRFVFGALDGRVWAVKAF